MDIETARQNVGAEVTYQPELMGGGRGEPETGVITSVGREWVFVAYGRSMNSAATRAADLTLTRNGDAS